MKKTVYLPVEVKSRAFTAKLLLAKALLDKGFSVVIGPHGAVRDLALTDRNGVYIEKDFFYLRSKAMKAMKDNGFLLYAYDEEGLVYLSKELYIDTRTDRRTLELCDKVFTWGKEQNDCLVEAYGSIKDSFIEAGNPRFDIATHDYIPVIYSREIEEIKKYGEFILVNSNFTSVGSPRESAEQVMKIIKAHCDNDLVSKHQKLWENYYTSQSSVFDSLIEAICCLAENLDTKIVVRMHPAEGKEKWSRLTKYKNIILTSKYDANPWIYCSSAVVHHGCTTGLEASLIGKPVISYSPPYSMTGFPDEVSYPASDKEQLLSLVRSVLAGNSGRNEFADTIRKHVLLDDNMRGVSIDIISDAIYGDALSNNADSAVAYGDSRSANILDDVYWIRQLLKKMSGSKAPSKFPYETKKMICSRTKTLFGPDFKKTYDIKHVRKNVFFLTKK